MLGTHANFGPKAKYIAKIRSLFARERAAAACAGEFTLVQLLPTKFSVAMAEKAPRFCEADHPLKMWEKAGARAWTELPPHPLRDSGNVNGRIPPP